VHVIGELAGATGFGAGIAVTAKWAFEVGERWELLEGARGGQTQTDTPEGGSEVAVWSHPIDAHWAVGAAQGWPRLLLQVWRLDDDGRLEVAGYAVVHVPSAPGSHELSVQTWRPIGSAADE
jgi:B9 domain-containing protein 2